GMAEVEQVAAVLGDAHAGTLEERVVGQPLGERGAHADDLGFEPEARNHSALADPARRLLDAAGEARGGRQPFADAVPPATVGVPAGVDAEDVRAGLRR